MICAAPIIDPGEREMLCGPYGFRLWCKHYARIKEKDGRIRPLKLNILQRRFIDAVEWCLLQGIPIRLILLKPRQKGSSTIVQAFVYWMQRVRCTEVLIAGGKKKQTLNMRRILKRYALEDKAPWGGDKPFLGAEFRFGNDSITQFDTAKDDNLGRSGTYQAFVATEAALWSEYGVAAAKEVLTGAMKCVPNEPWSAIILESTSGGPAGTFYETWGAAQTMEDILAHGYRGGYIRIFAGVLEFADSYVTLPISEREEFERSLTAKELSLMLESESEVRKTKLGTPLDYMAFRRIAKEQWCLGDDRIYMRDFPRNPTEAFVAGSLNVFSIDGMAKIKIAMEARAHQRRWGLLEPVESNNPRSKRYAFRMTDPDAAKWVIWEFPTPGHKYGIIVDFMEFLFLDERGDKLDEHCVSVYRDGCWDQHGVWWPKAEVARTVNPCQWDPDVLTDEIVAGACLYGDCICIPENNKDGGVIRDLVTRGLNVYQQRTGVDVNAETKLAKPTGKYGFKTTGGEAEGTRKAIINDLIAEVREFGAPNRGVIVSERTYAEMSTFVRDKSQKAIALSGERDDSVIVAAIANHCSGWFTPYTVPAWDLGESIYQHMRLNANQVRRVGPAARSRRALR